MTATSASTTVEPPEATLPAATGAVAAAPPRRRGGRPKGSVSRPKPDPVALSPTARSTGAFILEVLAGIRSTTDAAKAIGVSPVRYYALESRAVHALFVACQPRMDGPPTDAELARVVARLRDDKKRLEGEAARLRALLRSTQRTLGVTPAPAAVSPKPGTPGAKRRARRPVVRALTAVRRLLQSAASTPTAPVATPPGEPGGG